MKGHMAKKQRKVPLQKSTGRVALISLFCAAAGVYAADTTDGWSYNAETATIEHNGESTMPRLTPIKKGNPLGDTTIKPVSKVKVSGTAKMLEDGVVFDGGEDKTGTLTMEKDAVLDSDRVTATGAALETVTTVKFEDGVKGKIDAAGATISAENHLSATAVSGDEIESITAKEISAKSAEGDAKAIKAKKIGSVTVDKVVGDIDVGQIKDITIGELDGNLSAGILGDVDSKDAKISLNVNEEKEISIENIVSEATIKGNSTDSEKKGSFLEVRSADKKLTLGGKIGAYVENASEGLVIDNVNGDIYLGDTTAKLGENALEVKGTLDGDLNSFGTISGNVDIDTINGNTRISSLDGDLTAKTLGKSELAEGESPSETDITISASDKGNRTIGIDTINGKATISMDDTDGSMTIEKIGQVNGDLTVNDYAKIKNIENVDGTLTLNGNDKQATAKVGYVKELFANADGLTDVDTADTVHLKGEKLTLKGETVKSESENSRTTIADLGKGETIGNVIVGDVKLDGSIDGFKGNLTANSTDDVNIENGYTGNIDIKEVRDANGNPAGNFRSDENAIAGDVKLGSVGNVEINGGIAANGELANGNLAIDNVLGNVDIKKGVAGDVEIGSAGGSMNVEGGIGGNFDIANSEGLVNVDKVGKDMTIGANGSTIKVGTVVGTAKIDGEGTFDITNAGGLELGNANGKLTITDNKLTLSDSSNINSMTDADGNAIGTNIEAGGNVKLTTLDKETTIDGFTGNLSVGTTTDINVTDKGLTGNLTVGTVDGKLASSKESKITGDIKLFDANEVALGGDVDGNITVLDKAGKVDVANVSGNLNITTASGDVTANGTIGGDLSVANANGNVSAKDVNGDMTVGKAGGDVSAATVTGNMTVDDLGGGKVSATEVGGTAKIAGNGTFDIGEADNLELGTTGGSLTLGENNLATVADSNLNSALDEEGNAKSTKIGSKIKVGTLDKTTTIDGFNGNLEANNTADINVTDKGLTGNLTVGTVDGKLASSKESKITGDIKLFDANEVALGGDVDGNITVLDKAGKVDVANVSGNLNITTASGDVTANGTIGGDLSVANANGNVSAKDVNGDMTVGKAGGDVSAATVTGNMTVDDLGGGKVSATEVGGTAKIAGNGTFDIGEADNLELGTTGGSLTLGENNLATVADSNLNSALDEEGNVKSTKIGSKIKVGTLDKESNINGFDGDVTIENATKIVNVDAKDANLNITMGGSKTDDILKVDNAKSVTVSGTGKATIENAGEINSEIAATSTVIDGQTLTQENNNTLITAKTEKGGSFNLNEVQDVEVRGGFDGSVKIAKATGTIDAATGEQNDALNVSDGVNADITVGVADGNVKVVGNIKNIDVTFDDSVNPNYNLDVSGNADSATVNNGNATIKTAGNLTAFDKSQKDVNLDIVNGKVTVKHASDILDAEGNNIEQTVSANKVTGTLTLNNVADVDLDNAKFGGNITVKGTANNFAIDTVGDLTFNAENEIDGSLTISESVNKITAGNIKNDLYVAMNKNTGAITVGNVGGTMTLGDAQGAVSAASASGVEATLNGGSLTISGDSGNVEATLINNGSLEIKGNAVDVFLEGKGSAKVANDSKTAVSESLTFTGRFDGEARFDTINGDVKANGNFVKDLTIDTAAGSVDLAEVDKVEIKHATGGENGKNVTVGQVNESLNVNLEKDTNLFVKGKVLGTATVNGGCDATFEQYAENVKVTDHLNGLLDIQNGVNNLEIKNVNETVVENGAGSVTAKFDDREASMNIDSVSGDMLVTTTKNVRLKIGNVDGLTNFFGTGDITIYDSENASFQTFSFDDGSITLDNSNVKFNGDVNGNANMMIENSNVDFATKLETAGDVKIDNSKVRFANNSDDRNSVVLKAAKLYGTSAKEMIDFLYNDTYGIGEDINQSSLTKHTLVGDHKDDGKIIAELGDDVDRTINVGHIKGSFYNNAENRVAFKIEKNSFFTDNVSSENEKAFAQILDSAEYTGNDASDEKAVAVKRNYYNLAQNGGFASALPQAVSRAARMNMDLANIVHLDTINRTSATRDMLNAYGKKLNEFGRTDSLVRGTSFVTVRNINRFASYGGDSYASGSNDYIYGGLVNAEYLVNEDLFAGLGVGGFQAKSSGKDNSGKAETQSFALNLYGDYAFYDGFDWYFGATYAFGMNKTDRQRGAEIAKSDWNSNLVGVFSGVRYTWKPFEDQSIAIKPLVGLNANFLLNPSYDEDAGGLDKLTIEERNYSSFKTIVGVEAVKAFDFGLSVAARMFYTHEFADNSYNVGATLSDSYRSYGSFVYRGYEMDRDAGIFGVGLGYDINSDWRVYLDYAAEVSGDVYHNLNAGVQLKF